MTGGQSDDHVQPLVPAERFEAAKSRAERRSEVLEYAYDIYRDARSRSNTIRATALTSIGLLSLLVGLAHPDRLAPLGRWGVPPLVLLGTGLALSLAVLLQTPVTIPFDAGQLVNDDLVDANHDDVLTLMLRNVGKAERTTRSYNNRAAFLVNLSLVAFLSAVVIVSFQIGIGAKPGLWKGAIAAASVVAVAFAVRRWRLWPSKSKEEEPMTDEGKPAAATQPPAEANPTPSGGENSPPAPQLSTVFTNAEKPPEDQGIQLVEGHETRSNDK